MSSTGKTPRNSWRKYLVIKKDNATAKCKYCPKELKTCSNTTNLKQHIERKHSDILQADEDLLSEINNRFQNLEKSRTLTISTFLDPRYKLYFRNATVAENTKHHVVGLVTSMIQQTETNQPTTTGSEAPQDVQEKKSNNDSVLPQDMDPLTWWRANQGVYPNLAKLAKLKLNAMATSVPCERLFSVAGNILTERRSQFGSRKAQQLIFLQQNKNH
ncbi:zinc finger BED domain-containing protein 4-like [Pieris rapae]|uniref:zinc finger BED domain-containing protein 4-like n=1 Tax=Pieris rapae TaxID=64459 RepID=UPI001E280925|nr:zinc finger BED domain-containing protein 4-like [Pieris rapae]